MKSQKETLTKKRILILEPKEEYLDKIINFLVDNIGKDKLEIETLRQFSYIHFPRDYDIYLIHLNYTSEESVEELREEQPWCKIYIGSTSCGVDISNLVTNRIVDGTYNQNNMFDINTTSPEIREEACKRFKAFIERRNKK